MPSSCGLAHSTSCSTCGIDMKKGVPPGNLGSSQQNANLYVIEVDATSAFVVELACAYSRLQVDGGELDELRNDESAPFRYTSLYNMHTCSSRTIVAYACSESTISFNKQTRRYRSAAPPSY